MRKLMKMMFCLGLLAPLFSFGMIVVPGSPKSSMCIAAVSKAEADSTPAGNSMTVVGPDATKEVQSTLILPAGKTIAQLKPGDKVTVHGVKHYLIAKKYNKATKQYDMVFERNKS